MKLGSDLVGHARFDVACTAGPLTKAQTARFLTLKNAKGIRMKTSKHFVTKAHIQKQNKSNVWKNMSLLKKYT